MFHQRRHGGENRFRSTRLSVFWLLVPVVLALIACRGNAAPPPADDCSPRIVFQSDAWVLLPSGSFHDTIIFARQGDGYGYKGMVYDRDDPQVYSGTVSADAVARLIAALKAPLRPAFRFGSLGAAGPEALQKVQSSIRKNIRDGPNTPRRKELLASVVEDQGKIEEAITRSRPVTHTDDYPRVSVSASLADCTNIEARSVSQHLYMLPWSIKGRGKTFDPAIAQALYALLPAGFGGRHRLGPVNPFPFDSLDEMFWSGMSDQLEGARAEDQAGVVLKALRAAFVVTDAGVAGSMHDPESRVPWQPDLIATLHLSTTSPNLEMRFRITIADGNASGLDNEIRRARALLLRVALSPILAGQMAVNADDHFTVDYWYGSSLHRGGSLPGDDGMGDFARYMAKMKHVELTPQQLQDAALVSEDGRPERQWVALSDGRTVLWHQLSQGDRKAYAESCGVDPGSMPFYGCVGRIFAANGNLIP